MTKKNCTWLLCLYLRSSSTTFITVKCEVPLCCWSCCCCGYYFCYYCVVVVVGGDRGDGCLLVCFVIDNWTVEYLIIIPKEVDQEEDQETDGGIVYKQILRSVKLTTGKKDKKIELTGKGPLRRRRSALDCSATEQEKDCAMQSGRSIFKYSYCIFNMPPSFLLWWTIYFPSIHIFPAMQIRYLLLWDMKPCHIPGRPDTKHLILLSLKIQLQ
jgi:hypothetical protein